MTHNTNNVNNFGILVLFCLAGPHPVLFRTYPLLLIEVCLCSPITPGGIEFKAMSVPRKAITIHSAFGLQNAFYSLKFKCYFVKRKGSWGIFNVEVKKKSGAIFYAAIVKHLFSL